MKNKKTQIQMTENIVIIAIIIFIIVFGFMFYSKLRTGTIEQKSREYSELETVKAAQIISNLPELSCSRNSLVDIGCFDKFKLEAFINLELTKDYFEYYRSLFGKSTIIINEIYPDNQTNYTLYNNTYDDLVTSDSVFVPINLYDPLGDYLSFGYMQIITYSLVT